MKKKLSLGASSYAGEYLIPMMLPDWQKSGNNSELKVEIGDSESIFEQVLSGDLEVGLIGVCFEHEDLETQEFILNDELVLICPTDHPLASQDKLSVADLKGQNFCVREPGSATRMWMRESLARQGVSFDDLNLVCELDTHKAIVSAVQAGVGLACVPKLVAKEAAWQDKVKEINIEGLSPINGSMCTIWNKQLLTQDGEELLSFLDSEKAKMSDMMDAA